MQTSKKWRKQNVNWPIGVLPCSAAYSHAQLYLHQKQVFNLQLATEEKWNFEISFAVNTFDFAIASAFQHALFAMHQSSYELLSNSSSSSSSYRSAVWQKAFFCRRGAPALSVFGDCWRDGSQWYVRWFLHFLMNFCIRPVWIIV